MTEHRSRAQLVLVGALLLALTLVAVALILNGLLASENAATEPGPDSESVTSEQYQQAVTGTASSSLRTVNTNNTANASHATLAANVSAILTEWKNTTRNRYAAEGRAVDATVAFTHNGTRIRQTNASRDLTAGGAIDGQVNWTLVEDIEDPHRFVMTVSTDTMLNATNDTTGAALTRESFHVTVDAPAGVWRIYMFRGAATEGLYVLVEDPSENYDLSDGYADFLTDACLADMGNVTVRFTEGVVGDHHCPELDFFAGLSGPYDVSYNNSEDRRGTYDLFVNRTGIDGTPYHTMGSGDSPFTQTALYAAGVDVEYETDGVSYESTPVVPPSPAPHGPVFFRPVVDGISVTDTSTSLDPSFAVDWDVSDEDGDLKNVTVLLTRETVPTTGPVTVDSNATTVSGTSASSPPTLTVEGGVCDVEYNVEVVVYDQESGSDTAVHRETADC